MLNTFKSLYRYLNPRFQNVFLDYKVDMKPRYGHGTPPHSRLYDIINAHRTNYEQNLRSALQYAENIFTIQLNGQESDPKMPVWNNGFLPGLDIIMIYTLLATQKPQKYIEVGSGNSTKVAFKAKKDQALTTEIISIDPYPRVEIDQVANKVIKQPFENTDKALFRDLGSGDIVFIDNSHRILPNSDATVFFLEILPELPKGVIVHIHDIYLPYDYPQFMCDRAYSEQYALACFLLANPEKYRPICPNYFISEDKALNEILTPFWSHPNLKDVEKHGGSFWLQINVD